MLLPILLALSVLFTVGVMLLLLRGPPAPVLTPDKLDPVRQMIERVQREHGPDYDPRQSELDFG